MFAFLCGNSYGQQDSIKIYQVTWCKTSEVVKVYKICPYEIGGSLGGPVRLTLEYIEPGIQYPEISILDSIYILR